MSRLLVRRALRRQRKPHIVPKPTSEVVLAKAKTHDVDLSPFEVQELAKRVEHMSGGDPFAAQRQFQLRLWRVVEAEIERDTLLRYRFGVHDGTFGQRLLLGLEFLTVALFAILGTKIAGQAGMNVVGVTFAGVMASIGGATLNDLMLGSYMQRGVFWMEDRRFLVVSVGVSLAAFWLWPEYESWSAMRFLHLLQDGAEVPDGTEISLPQFKHALERNPHLSPRIRTAIATPMGMWPAELDNAQGVELMFKWLDQRQCGHLDRKDLQRLASLRSQNSPLMYAMEAILTGTAGISGANAALMRGMHPMVCVACSVSISFGGIFRDVFCGRDVAAGSSSFAFACGLSGTTYVGLRQLELRGLYIPYALRIVLAISAAVSQRAYCWFYLEPGTHFFDKMKILNLE